MASRYFSQYLLNKGVLSPDNAGSILAKTLDVKPHPLVVAVDRGLVTSKQAAELANEDDFAQTALEKGYLTAFQLEDLKRAIPERSVCLGQVLLDEKIVTLDELAELFAESGRLDQHPVQTVVGNVLQARGFDAHDYEYVGDYVELFMSALQRFMNTDALLYQADKCPETAPAYLTYQSMGGALRLTAGCRVGGDVLLTMASRFSDESLSEIDEMAIDCIEEFCNVFNGLYIVNMSGKSQDMDLDMPHTIEDGEPEGNGVMRLRVETEFGAFMLYMSTDGFVLG